MTTTAGIDTPSFGSAPLKNVVTAMETGRFKRVGIPEIARKDSAEMQRIRKQRVTWDDATVEAEFKKLLPKDAPWLPEWDSAAQLYYALAARERARGGGSSDVLPDFRNALIALRTDDWPHVKWSAVNESLTAIRKKRP